MTTFKDLGLPENILHSLESIGFETPTPIQEKAIPVILDGHDVLGSAQTGTGKTGAFGIPMMAKISNSQRGIALILTPTRELAEQVWSNMNQLISRTSRIKTALLIGGDAMPKQLRQLSNKPRIIVGTPGRVNDHLKRGSLKLNDTEFLVLDETDRMLDMGFGIQLDEIAKYLPTERQTLMFSATLPTNIMSLAKRFLNNPVRIAVGSTHQPLDKIKQETIKTNDNEKYGVLMQQLKEREGSIVVFVKTKFSAERLAIKINKEVHSTNDNQFADAIHGDLRQSRRDRVIANFRAQKYRVLVATDIAARGLDIPHIQHVINYDLPQCPEDYIHRIGRTARAGAEGCAVNFLTAKDSSKWKAIYKLINPANRMKDMPEECPLDVAPMPVKEKKSKQKKTTANPFNPYAPDKKAKSRAKFNRNSHSFDVKGKTERARPDNGLSRKTSFKKRGR